MRTAQAVNGFAEAMSDFVDRFDCQRPTAAELIERLIDTPLRAQFCRGYLAFFVQHNLFSREDADMLLGEIAPDSWSIRYLPDSYLES